MDSINHSKYLNINGRLMDLSIPKIMGVINVTKDSFYDGGEIITEKDLLSKVDKMINEGVDIIDVGAYSSRPMAEDIPLETEIKNACWAVSLIKKHFPNTPISIDTFRSKVAYNAVKEGANIINDISAGRLDDNMFATLPDLNVPYIMMHMRGTPQSMATLTDYNDVVSEIIDYFIVAIIKLRDLGVKDIIIDPGFGFAKTIDQNFILLDNLSKLRTLNLPILCGVSRKSMIYKILNITAKEALNGTTALNMACLMKGASILRVHDVKEAKQTVKLFQSITNNLQN